MKANSVSLAATEIDLINKSDYVCISNATREFCVSNERGMIDLCRKFVCAVVCC